MAEQDPLRHFARGMDQAERAVALTRAGIIACCIAVMSAAAVYYFSGEGGPEEERMGFASSEAPPQASGGAGGPVRPAGRAGRPSGSESLAYGIRGHDDEDGLDSAPRSASLHEALKDFDKDGAKRKRSPGGMQAAGAAASGAGSSGRGSASMGPAGPVDRPGSQGVLARSPDGGKGLLPRMRAFGRFLMGRMPRGRSGNSMSALSSTQQTRSRATGGTPTGFSSETGGGGASLIGAPEGGISGSESGVTEGGLEETGEDVRPTTPPPPSQAEPPYVTACGTHGNTRCGAFTCAVEEFSPIETKIRNGLRRQFQGARWVMGKAKEDVGEILKLEGGLRAEAEALKALKCEAASEVGDYASERIAALSSALREEQSLLDKAIPACADTADGGNVEENPCGVKGLAALRKELAVADSVKAFGEYVDSQGAKCGSCAEVDKEKCGEFLEKTAGVQKQVYKDGTLPELDPPWCARYPPEEQPDAWCDACRCVLGRVREAKERLGKFLEYASEFESEVPGIVSKCRSARRDIHEGEALLWRTLRDDPEGNRNQSYFQGIERMSRASKTLQEVMAELMDAQARNCR